jgi:hypothetical protein
LYPILAIQDHACSTVGIEHGRRRSQLLELTSGFLATRAKARAGQNRWANCLELHLAALARRGEAFMPILVHYGFPFLRQSRRLFSSQCERSATGHWFSSGENIC